MAKLHPVKLTPSERETRRAMTTKGRHGALCPRRARTLLLAAEGRGDQGVARALRIARTTVERTRRRCFEEGVQAALQRRPQRRPSRRPSSTASRRRIASKGPRESKAESARQTQSNLPPPEAPPPTGQAHPGGNR